MSNDIKNKIIEVIDNMITEWELDFEDELNSEVFLIQDLDFSSVDFVELFVRIEDKLQRKLGFHDLIMQEDKYIDDLNIQQIIDFVNKSNQQALNIVKKSATKQVNLQEKITPITPEEIKQFRQNIPEPPLINNDNNQKNNPAIFILCPSRSGSTLLRVILAGNTQIFAPPELHLLCFDTLQTRYQALDNDGNRHLLNGTIRAIMKAKNCSLEEAEKIMKDCQEKNLSTQSFYQLLQQWIGNQLLLDKTPSYAYHINFLKAAEIQFDNPLYIHLLRHPYGMIRSFEDAKMNELLPFMQSNKFSQRQYAELAWLVCHQNIISFLEEIPPQRKLQIKFEDLVVIPEVITKKICNFLKVDFQAEMLKPYTDKNQRMTDGLDNSSRMSGDLKFHLHRQIEPNIAYRWRQYHTEDFLGNSTWELAESFGYDREN